MAGMEVCIRTVKEHGAELFDNYRHELNKFYKNCEDLKRLHVMTGKDLSKEEAFAWDESKIVIFVRDSSKSAEWLYQELLLKYHLQLEDDILKLIPDTATHRFCCCHGQI